MPKKTLTKIITITSIIWFIGTATYALISISTEISRTEFFPILVVVDFVTGKLPLFVVGLVIAIVIELTVWAMLPERTER
jgi:hypothetical protein